MNRTRIATAGGLILAAAAVVAVALLIPGREPADTPNSRPAGQVEQVEESTTSNPTIEPVSPVNVPVGNPPPADGDTGAVNPPAEQVPPPGVPYDSDGATVAPNPPNMGPGELAPRPPTQNPPEPAPEPVDPPVIPTHPADANGS